MKRHLFSLLALSAFCLVSYTSSYASDISSDSKEAKDAEVLDEASQNEINEGEVISDFSNIAYSGENNLESSLAYSNLEEFGSGYISNYNIYSQYYDDKKVDTMRTSLQASVEVRNSATLTVSETTLDCTNEKKAWNTVKSDAQWFESNNKELRKVSTITVVPAKDCKQESLKFTSTTSVKLKGDPQAYEVVLEK